ncbi:MAG: hypothetical protein ABFC94_19065 [Syntrophomonas sp.]
MKKSLTWLIRQSVFWIFAIEAIVLIALMKYGFGFVYAPYMENNWEAIGATG